MITLGTTSGDYNVKYTLRKQAGTLLMLGITKHIIQCGQ